MLFSCLCCVDSFALLNIKHCILPCIIAGICLLFLIYFQVTATRQLIQESMKEMEAHKAKRLAARSEMINLAKVNCFMINAKLLIFYYSFFNAADKSNLKIACCIFHRL